MWTVMWVNSLTINTLLFMGIKEETLQRIDDTLAYWWMYVIWKLVGAH